MRMTRRSWENSPFADTSATLQRDRDAERAELDRQIAAFLERGGRIQQLSFGISPGDRRGGKARSRAASSEPIAHQRFNW